jgi:hypothetical protein
MEQTLENICDAVREKLKTFPILKDGSLSKNFAGQCGFAMSMIFCACEDLGIQYKPFMTSSFTDTKPDHATGIIEDHTGRKFVIDPTFIQFCGTGNPLAAGNILTHSKLGLDILTDLTKRGFFELTTEKMETYLHSFLIGKNLDLTDEALVAFIEAPPQNHEFVDTLLQHSDVMRGYIDEQNLLLHDTDLNSITPAMASKHTEQMDLSYPE